MLLHRVLRPLVPLALVWRRPKGYAKEPKSLGEHLLKRRLSLGLTQAQAGLQLLANEWTYMLWEKDRTTPAIRFYPAIFAFLGYDPFPAPTTLGERVFARRRGLGLSQKEAAQRIGIDPSTFSLLETGKFAEGKYEHQLADFLSTNSAQED